MLLGIEPTIGRIAVREPRLTDRLEMVLDLAGVNGIDIRVECDELREPIKACNTQRDLIAHGLWVRDDQTREIHLRRITGKWQPVPATRGSVKRSVEPSAELVTESELSIISRNINSTSQAVNALRARVEVLLQPLP